MNRPILSDFVVEVGSRLSLSPHFFFMPIGGVLAVLGLGYLWMITLSFYMKLKEESRDTPRSRAYPGPTYEVEV